VGGVVSLKRKDSKHWEVGGTSLKDCHISALAVEPSKGLILAGAHNASLHASLDSGKTWEPRNNGIVEKEIYSINFVRSEEGTKLYAGTEPAHLYESDDLGETWRDLPALRSVPSVPQWTFPAPPHAAHVKHIAFDPTNPKKIYASIEVGGLLKTEDGGTSWHELSGFYEDVHRIVVRPSSPKCLYMTGGDGIYHSRDEGETWDHLTTRTMRIAYPDALVFHPRREDLMFMAGAVSSPGTWRQTHTADSRIARTRDGGQSWEILHEGLPEHIRGNMEALALEAWDGSMSLFGATTDGDVFLSEDEGDHWTKIAGGLPPISKTGHYRNLQ
jgi:photosystem II stability/assembly factor-like uncharacterized protein